MNLKISFFGASKLKTCVHYYRCSAIRCLLFLYLILLFIFILLSLSYTNLFLILPLLSLSLSPSYEIQLSVEARRKGLGKFLMQLLELIGHKANMRKIVLTVFKGEHR